MNDRNEYYKEYYKINKEKMKQQIKDNYKLNKDIINRKIKCSKCGRVVIARMYKKHLSTIIHNNTDYKEEDIIEQIKPEKINNTINNSINSKNGYVIFQ